VDNYSALQEWGSGARLVHQAGKLAAQERPSATIPFMTDILAVLLAERARIDAAIKAFQGSHTTTTTTKKAPQGNRKPLSAAARKRIGDAQRARWAKKRKQG
jgi:hypothetical protein